MEIALDNHILSQRHLLSVRVASFVVVGVFVSNMFGVLFDVVVRCRQSDGG